MSIKAIFPAGVTALTVNGLHQWDYGQTLDIEAPDLPLLVEVHFACTGMAEAVVRVCQVVDGKTSAVIPDACLEQRSPVVAWVYEVDEVGGKTILTVTMPVIARIKPPAGTSSPVVADQYAQLIALVNDQMDALFSGAAPVGRAFEADHAAAVDTAAHATEADHAAAADTAAHATEADHAAAADTAAHATEADHAAAADTAAHAAEADHAAAADTAAHAAEADELSASAVAEIAAVLSAARIVKGTAQGTGTNTLTLSVGFVPTVVVLHAGAWHSADDANYANKYYRDLHVLVRGANYPDVSSSSSLMPEFVELTDKSQAILGSLSLSVDDNGGFTLTPERVSKQYNKSGQGAGLESSADDRFTTYEYIVIG